jgi:hypothetical protein
MSLEGEVGKSAISIGTALHAQDHGLKVGYMKPVGYKLSTAGGRLVDSEVSLIKEALKLTGSVEDICPVLLTHVLRREALIGKDFDAVGRVRDSFLELSRDKDLMIVEGPGTLRMGITLGIDASTVIDIVDAKAVVVLRGEFFEESADAALFAKRVLGERLIGAIVTGVPVSSVDEVRSVFGAYLQRKGMQLFGILPAGRLPGTFSVAELATMLNGQLITGGSGEDVMVDRFVVGAMGPEAALRHFLRQANKAVITGGDRTDVILAALETSTRCLILTGNLIPEQVAIATAAHRQVPLMVVPWDTMETIRMIEEASGPVRLTTLAHVEALRGLTDRELYVARILRALGL